MNWVPKGHSGKLGQEQQLQLTLGWPHKRNGWVIIFSPWVVCTTYTGNEKWYCSPEIRSLETGDIIHLSPKSQRQGRFMKKEPAGEIRNRRWRIMNQTSYFFFRCNTVKIKSSFAQGKVIEFGTPHLNQNHLQPLLCSGSIPEYCAILYINHLNAGKQKASWEVLLCCIKISGIHIHISDLLSSSCSFNEPSE